MPLSPVDFSFIGTAPSPISSWTSLGSELSNILNQKLEREKMEAGRPYWGKTAEEEFKSKELANQLSQFQVEHQEEAFKTQQALTNQQISASQAQADYHKAQADKLKAVLADISGQPASKTGGYTPIPDKTSTINPSPIGSSNTQIPSEENNSFYGITIPDYSPEDKKNKTLYNQDTYTPKRQRAEDQIQNERKYFLEKSIQNSQALNNANSFMTRLNSYNSLMDKTSIAGPVGGLLPARLSSNAQSIDHAVSIMNTEGIQRFREAMNSARFSNLDVGLSIKQVPQRDWSDGARQFATEFFNVAKDRMGEQSKFFDVVRNHPHMGLNSADAEGLWRSYQDNFPVSNGDDKIERKNLNKWPLYLTPAAIKSYKETGDYKPDPALLNAVMMRYKDPKTGIEKIVPVKPENVSKAIKDYNAETV